MCDHQNRTFVNKNRLWYNSNTKGGFTMNKALLKQMGGIYTMPDDYCQPAFTLPAEDNAPSACGHSVAYVI